MDISRLEVFITLLTLIVPVAVFIVAIIAFSERVKPMARYNIPKSERRPETMTMSEEFTEATRRG